MRINPFRRHKKRRSFLNGRENLLITHLQPKSPVTEAFRTMRTNLSFATIGLSHKLIMFTSAGPDDGKSTVLANTAVVHAQAGQRVLIIDCDLRKPVQHRIFQLTNAIGLTNILLGELTAQETIRETAVTNLSLLTSGPIPPNPAELISSNRMNDFLSFVSTAYDIVLLDCPPVLAVTDAALLARRVNGIILVIWAGHTRTDVIKDAKQQLEKAGGRILGVVLNKINVESEDYYYSYYYYYYHREGEKSRHEPETLL